MTHKELLDQMHRLELTEAEAMLLLNDAGLISDNCVRLWDIVEPDLSTAKQWLKAKRVRYGDGTGDTNAKVLR